MLSASCHLHAASVENLARDLKVAETDVERAQFDERSKREEWKVVTRAAKAKRDEVEELERLVLRLEQLRLDALVSRSIRFTDLCSVCCDWSQFCGSVVRVGSSCASMLW